MEQDKKQPKSLTTSNWLVVNFRRGKLEWKRLQSNQEFIVDMETVEEAAPF